MDNDSDLCRQASGESWCHSSPTWKYLENLPLGNTEESFRASPRFLLPRKEIFTFGIQDGMKDRLIYHRCKICNAILKSYQLKHHMYTHSKHEGSSGTSHNLTSSLNKIKKPLHKSKKKILPPPAVPPPPLFVQKDFDMPIISMLDPPIREICVPVKETIQLPEPTIIVEDSIETTVVPVTTANHINMSQVITTNLIDTKRSISETSSICIPSNSLTIRGIPVSLSTVPKAPVLVTTEKPKLPLPVLKLKGITTTVPTSKPIPLQIALAKPLELETLKPAKRKRIKQNTSCSFYDPDRHCGVVDIAYGYTTPCMRAIICSNHTITERRHVIGRSKPLDALIRDYKAVRVKSKPSTISKPVTIAPKCAPKGENKALQIVEYVYDSQDKEVVECVNNSLTSKFGVPQITKFRGVKDKICILNSKKGVGKASHPIPKLYLSSNSDEEHNGEVPSTMPTGGNVYPKPLAVPTSLRRVGRQFVLQQAHRLERQRLDLQTVANQHKQLKLSSPNKTVYVVNNKHSILKNNIKNLKSVTTKRDRNSIDIKSVKIISADINGFMLNSDVQSNNMVDKMSLLK